MSPQPSTANGEPPSAGVQPEESHAVTGWQTP